MVTRAVTCWGYLRVIKVIIVGSLTLASPEAEPRHSKLIRLRQQFTAGAFAQITVLRGGRLGDLEADALELLLVLSGLLLCHEYGRGTVAQPLERRVSREMIL